MCDLDLTLDQAVVTLYYKILFVLLRCRKLILVGTLAGGVGVQCHGVTLI